MDDTGLPAALRACVHGICTLEAAAGLIIEHATWLGREDFTSRFIEHGASGGTPMAAIDWDAAITALHAGDLPCSAGERRILAAAASIAVGIRVDLRDTATGLDARNIRLLITAISHAAGQRPR
jgi:hypothetical protein